MGARHSPGARQMKMALRPLFLLLLALLGGCFPSPEKIGELTRTSIEQRLRNDPQYRDSEFRVLAVRVTSPGNKVHDAVATVSHAGQSRDIPIKIVVDGINLEWFAGNGAFDFLKTAPVTALPAPSPVTTLPAPSPGVAQIPR
ncbi:MAG TPA: hypothetical protein PKN13_13360 [Accumulibacter sp.]|nr:hypothetical protein [Accumulibacter sp.]HMW18694.1 hypothetical protein [Accumulibacter sp.]HNC18790.1 hypothetical protein [Accumulibacter sp.]HND81469.1 hypothetical protein [Accumulibacter sp.]HNH23774.1 hypothetical protein [Accumulibacter sp.]